VTSSPMSDSDDQTESEAAPSSVLERLVAQVLDHEVTEDDVGSDASTAVKSIVARVLLHEQYKGVFPHPANLREFDEVVSNGAERAFALTELEQQHRHKCDDKLIDSQIDAQHSFDSDRRMLIILGFVVVLLLVAGAIILAAIGKNLGAGVLGGVSILTAAGGALLFKARSTRDGPG
jgi:uncharacterized membrane protein